MGFLSPILFYRRIAKCMFFNVDFEGGDSKVSRPLDRNAFRRLSWDWSTFMFSIMRVEFSNLVVSKDISLHDDYLFSNTSVPMVNVRLMFVDSFLCHLSSKKMCKWIKNYLGRRLCLFLEWVLYIIQLRSTRVYMRIFSDFFQGTLERYDAES